MLLSSFIVQQDLLQERTKGTDVLGRMVEAGENLLSVSTGDSRNAIRQQMNSIQQEWDDFYSRANDASRHVAVNIVEWSSLSDSIKQIEAWLEKMEASLGNEWTPGGMIEEKKSLLQSHRVRMCF
jgi:hypothetical protein